MNRLPTKLIIALLTFILGVTAVWISLLPHHILGPKLTTQLPDRVLAGLMIQSSASFTGPKEEILSVTTPYYPCLENTSGPIYARFQEMGLVEIRKSKARRACYQVNLTDKGEIESHNWPRGDTDIYDMPEAWLVPIADRELGAIKDIVSRTADTAEVRFVWKWKPNALGEKLDLNTEPHVCVVEFQRRGTIWFAPQYMEDELDRSEGKVPRRP
jgi:hypothetical protein